MYLRVVFVLALLSSFACVLGGNLLVNGNFAQKDEDGNALGWEVWPSPLHANAEVQLDNTNSHSAGQSMRISNKSELYSRIQQLNVPCKPHTQYVASFWAKGDSIYTTRGGGSVMYIGPHGGLMRSLVAFGPRSDHSKISPGREGYFSFPWKYYESRVFNSGDSKELGVTLYLHNSSGTVWFDDVEIVEYTPDRKKEREASLARKLLQHDLQTLRQNAPGNQAFLKKIESYAEKLRVWYPEQPGEARAGLPFYDLQREIFALNAELLQAAYPGVKLAVTSSDPLQRLLHLQCGLPVLNAPLELHGMKGEQEPVVLNFSNCSAEAVELELKIEGGLDVQVREVVSVETEANYCVDDALPLLRPDATGRLLLKIAGGMTRQVYFLVTLGLEPGLSESPVSWSGGGVKGSALLKAHSYDTNYPNSKPLNTFSYSYYSRFALDKKSDASIACLRNMHQNTRLIHPHNIINPVFDEQGKIQADEMNWDNLDAERQLMVQPGKLIFYMRPSFFLGEMKGAEIVEFSDEWRSRVQQYVRVLVEACRQRGLGYDRVFLNLCDEPSERDMPYMLAVAATVKECDPQLRIYNNLHYGLAPNSIRKLAAAIDVIAPEKNVMNPERMKILRDSGKEIWCYWVQNRTVPGSEMRDFISSLAAQNVRGFSYWCFKDMANPWRPGVHQSYSVVYGGDPDEWIPSKRSEAIREGIELYTLLEMLKQSNQAAYAAMLQTQGTNDHATIRKQILQMLTAQQ